MRLILLRHAKSSTGDPSMDDIDRPLNRRGREAAPRIGGWLRETGQLPARILCSPAARTRQTLEGLGLTGIPAGFPDDLYLADAGTILRAALAQRVDTLVVGHNPGMAEAAARAVSEPPAHSDFARYPTAACAVIEVTGDLPGRLLAFTVPRDL